MIDFIDLFAGVGGFHLGLDTHDRSKNRGVKTDSKGEPETGARLEPTQRQEANFPIGPDRSGLTNRPHSGSSAFECVWANEWDKYAAQTYRKNFPDTTLSTDDIRKVPAESIPDHDLLCAGFPCQAFSVAGKRRGLEEARGTLFYEIARIAECKRPRILLLENVKGLLNHDEGRTFATILRVMGSIGYRLEWQVFNSKWFGVPQNRERVFIIGHLGEPPARTVFPITEIGGNAGERIPETPSEQTACSITVGYGKQNMRGSYMATTALDANYGKGIDNHGQRTAIIQPYAITDSGLHREKQIRVNTLPPLRAGRGCDREDTVQIVSGQRIRRLTPVECERLQGFPDGWTSGVSDTQRYKQMGNAVTVNVIRFLAPRIASILASKSDTSESCTNNEVKK